MIYSWNVHVAHSYWPDPLPVLSRYRSPHRGPANKAAVKKQRLLEPTWQVKPRTRPRLSADVSHKLVPEANMRCAYKMGSKEKGGTLELSWESKPVKKLLISRAISPMANISVNFIVISSFAALLSLSLLFPANAANFTELFEPSWALDHVIYDGELLQLKLDNFSGAGFGSKNKYLYGRTRAEIKLVPGDSAGTVTAFYMSSDGPAHNEFDFEFLGNTTGEPYLVQSNIYVNGVGNREQRMDLWFDPTADFHAYSIHWNQKQVVFMIDETPIRVFENKEAAGVAYPKDQPMGVYSSLWNADDWATQGGRVKTNWTHAPFVTTYRAIDIDGCRLDSATEVKRCGGSYWWKEPVMEELSVHQSHQLMWVRAKHLVYDYCGDVARFPTKPMEC